MWYRANARGCKQMEERAPEFYLSLNMISLHVHWLLQLRQWWRYISPELSQPIRLFFLVFFPIGRVHGDSSLGAERQTRNILSDPSAWTLTMKLSSTLLLSCLSVAAAVPLQQREVVSKPVGKWFDRKSGSISGALRPWWVRRLTKARNRICCHCSREHQQGCRHGRPLLSQFDALWYGAWQLPW